MREKQQPVDTDTIVSAYRRFGTLKATAEHLRMGPNVVKRHLVREGVLKEKQTHKQSRAQIRTHYEGVDPLLKRLIAAHCK